MVHEIAVHCLDRLIDWLIDWCTRVLGELSFEVQEFFRETSSEAALVDAVTDESPTLPDRDDVTTRDVTSSMTSCRRDVTQHRPHRPPVRTAATATADGSAGYKHRSSSTSSAPSTWIAFKVQLSYHQLKCVQSGPKAVPLQLYFPTTCVNVHLLYPFFTVAKKENPIELQKSKVNLKHKHIRPRIEPLYARIAYRQPNFQYIQQFIRYMAFHEFKEESVMIDFIKRFRVSADRWRKGWPWGRAATSDVTNYQQYCGLCG